MLRRVHLRGADPRLAARAAAVGLTLAVGVTACGGSGGQDSSKALSAVKSAYEQTTGAETVKISLTGKRQQGSKSPAPAGQQSQKITGSASLNYKDDESVTLIDSAGPTTSETRTIGNALYRKVPKQQRQTVPGKKPWIKIDLKKIAKSQYGKQASDVTDNPPSDPAGVLMYLRGVVSATAKGTQSIDGTETTQYSTKVNVVKAAKKQGPQAERQAKGLKQQLGKATMSMQVWLDSQNRVRRLKTTLPGGSPKSPGITVTENFHDYGASVKVDAPSGSKTADVTKQVLMQQKMRQRMQQQRQQQQQGSPPASPSS